MEPILRRNHLHITITLAETIKTDSQIQPIKIVTFNERPLPWLHDSTKRCVS